jgi:hypothetical protein
MNNFSVYIASLFYFKKRRSTPRLISSSFITASTYGLKELEEKGKEAQQWLDKFEKLAAKENNVKLKSEIIGSNIKSRICNSRLCRA